MNIGLQFADYNNKIVLYDPSNPAREHPITLDKEDYEKFKSAFEWVMYNVLIADIKNITKSTPKKLCPDCKKVIQKIIKMRTGEKGKDWAIRVCEKLTFIKVKK